MSENEASAGGTIGAGPLCLTKEGPDLESQEVRLTQDDWCVEALEAGPASARALCLVWLSWSG